MFTDGISVGSLHHVEPTEGADEHEERRARQVKVGQEDIDRPELSVPAGAYQFVAARRFGISLGN